MEKTLFNKSEVADRLRISEGTLTTYGSRHRVYRADGAGIFHIEHVRILEKVRANIVSPAEGLAMWEFRKMKMRRSELDGIGERKAATRRQRKGGRGGEKSE